MFDLNIYDINTYTYYYYYFFSVFKRLSVSSSNIFRIFQNIPVFLFYTCIIADGVNFVTVFLLLRLILWSHFIYLINFNDSQFEISEQSETWKWTSHTLWPKIITNRWRKMHLVGKLYNFIIYLYDLYNNIEKISFRQDFSF